MHSKQVVGLLPKSTNESSNNPKDSADAPTAVSESPSVASKNHGNTPTAIARSKKREFRKLWILRVNAGVRQHGVSYSKFIALQNKSGVILDRKILSGLAMYEPFSFKAVVDVVQKMAVEGGDGAGK
mmetsp:Transcript_27166/g.58389  ORF Transcript_27166/g.58389 Transcript_27166/m.58389 type:complete len:127 (-) Transcript_27166:396-776(-)